MMGVCVWCSVAELRCPHYHREDDENHFNRAQGGGVSGAPWRDSARPAQGSGPAAAPTLTNPPARAKTRARDERRRPAERGARTRECVHRDGGSQYTSIAVVDDPPLAVLGDAQAPPRHPRRRTGTPSPCARLQGDRHPPRRACLSPRSPASSGLIAMITLIPFVASVALIAAHRRRPGRGHARPPPAPRIRRRWWRH